MAAPRILLLGSTGQVGWELRRTLAPLGRVIAASRAGAGGPALDFARPDSVRALLEDLRPEVVVNAAAYTAVDQAERDAGTAQRVNAEVPGVIGTWAAGRGAGVVHYSTDYVFDGSTPGRYRESDPPNPLNLYGRTKLAGEQALLEAGAAALILRVGWVYGQRGRNFLRTMQGVMAERELVRVVDDQLGTPTWSRAIAEATAAILAQLRCNPAALAERRGVYHLAPAGAVSWYGFAQRIRDTGGYGCRLEPITTADYPTPAARPPNSLLDAQRLSEVFGIALPAWDELFALCTDAT